MCRGCPTAKQPEKLGPVPGAGQTVQVKIDGDVAEPQHQTNTERQLTGRAQSDVIARAVGQHSDHVHKINGWRQEQKGPGHDDERQRHGTQLPVARCERIRTVSLRQGFPGLSQRLAHFADKHRVGDEEAGKGKEDGHHHVHPHPHRVEEPAVALTDEAEEALRRLTRARGKQGMAVQQVSVGKSAEGNDESNDLPRVSCRQNLPRSVRPDDAQSTMDRHENQQPGWNFSEGVRDPDSEATQHVHHDVIVVSLHVILDTERDPEGLQRPEPGCPQGRGVGHGQGCEVHGHARVLAGRQTALNHNNHDVSERAGDNDDGQAKSFQLHGGSVQQK